VSGTPAAELILVGGLPPLADGFVPRTEAGRAVLAELVPGATVALVSARPGNRTPPDAIGPGSRGAGTAPADDWRDPVGKTQLAAHAARILRDTGDVNVLVWVSATSQAAVLSAYSEAAAAVEGQEPGNAEQAAVRFASWLRETSRPWLVVFDDLAAAAVPAGLWPASPAGRVLVTATTAATLPTAPYGPVRVLPVGPFSRREALTYLMGRLKNDVDQRQGAADLVEDLGDEPLALAQASAVIMDSDLLCTDYGGLVARARRTASGSESPAAAITWALSVEHADLLAPDAAEPPLIRAALLDGNGIPAPVLGDPGAVTALAQASLITVDETAEPPLIRVNRATQAAVRYAMTDGMLAAAATAAADALVREWPAGDEPEWLARCLRSCTRALHDAAGDALWNGDGCHEVLLRAGSSLDTARLPGPAVRYWEELTAGCEKRFGREHSLTLAARERLARAHLRAGRTRESLDWFEQIRSDRVRTLGAYHPATAQASHDLGRALLTAGKPEDAIGALADAVGGYERAKGPGCAEALTAREDFAAAQAAAGHAEEAVVVYRRALADRERLHGKRHPDMMATYRRLADAYVAAGQPKQAISLYKRLMSDAERVLGASHPDTVAIRDSLAAAQYSAGRLASAISLYEQVRQERSQALGPDHDLTLTACLNLAHAYATASRPTDAANLLRATIRHCELTRTAGDPLVRTLRESLSNLTG
jgi:tetratricopeptide (TPR) repeat protein